MPRVENCASTCANQTSGSAGQKGGSLRFTAAMVGAAARASSPVAMTLSFRVVVTNL